MRSSPSEAAAREPSFPRKQDTFPDLRRRIIRKTWRIWSGACFAVVLLAVFAQPLLAQIIPLTGHMYGNGQIWPFSQVWQGYLDTPGTE